MTAPGGGPACQDDLIFDIGMHRGEDTEFYLSKGYRVVAFEADPDLVAHCRRKFSGAIEAGRLTIVAGAIAEGQGSIPFYRNTHVSVWGTVSPDWRTRNEKLGAPAQPLEVERVDFAAALRRFGVPYFMKIDIEGSELICLRALLGQSARPRYLSLESDKLSFAALRTEFDLLTRLGYRRFAVVQQLTVKDQPARSLARDGRPVEHRFEEGSSGNFGPDLPCRYWPRWLALLIYRWVFLSYRLVGDPVPPRRSPVGRALEGWAARRLRGIGIAHAGWYDTHAKL